MPAPSCAPDQSLLIYTDGASRHNPGESAIGVVIKNGRRETLETLSEYLGRATNNEAEYTALIRALEAARKFSPREVRCYLDSQLVVRQIEGTYKVKNAGLMPLFLKAKALYAQYDNISIRHIPREENWEADAMANAAFSKRMKKE